MEPFAEQGGRGYIRILGHRYRLLEHETTGLATQRAAEINAAVAERVGEALLDAAVLLNKARAVVQNLSADESQRLEKEAIRLFGVCKREAVEEFRERAARVAEIDVPPGSTMIHGPHKSGSKEIAKRIRALPAVEEGK